MEKNETGCKWGKCVYLPNLENDVDLFLGFSIFRFSFDTRLFIFWVSNQVKYRILFIFSRYGKFSSWGPLTNIFPRIHVTDYCITWKIL